MYILCERLKLIEWKMRGWIREEKRKIYIIVRRRKKEWESERNIKREKYGKDNNIYYVESKREWDEKWVHEWEMKVKKKEKIILRWKKERKSVREKERKKRRKIYQ